MADGKPHDLQNHFVVGSQRVQVTDLCPLVSGKCFGGVGGQEDD